MTSKRLPAGVAALLITGLALVSGNSYGVSQLGPPIDPRDRVVLGPLIGKVKAPLGRGEGFTTGHPGLEAEFVTRINAVRADQGLAAFKVHDNLVSKARNWSMTMAEAGEIFHSHLPDEIVVPWKRLGENVGVGPSVPSLHDAFVASPSHYKNLVDGGFDRVGIGITTTSDGTIYVGQVFMEVPASSPPPSGGSGGAQPPAAPKPGGTQPPAPPPPPSPPPKPPASKPPAPAGPAPTVATPTTVADATTATTAPSASPKLATEPISRSQARHNLPVWALFAALGGLALMASLLALRFARRFDPVS